MDIRIEKTKSAITNVFLELRSAKPLEKITIKELCEKAKINKSTFYSHYRDIYDLSEELENEVVASVIESLPGIELLFEDPADFTRKLMIGYIATDSLIQTLFSGTRSGELIRKIDFHLKQQIYRIRPELEHDPMTNILISYNTYGSYYAFARNRGCSDEETADLVAQISRIANESLKLL